MDKYLCEKGVYDEIEKAIRDRSHLTQKKITDKNGHQRTVWVKPGENPVQQKTKKNEEPAEKTIAKPKHEVGSMVHLDSGVAGAFKVDSVDKDGSYHVVSDDGRKYHVSENHLTAAKESKLKGKTMADKYGERYTVDSESEDGFIHVKDSKGNSKRFHSSALDEVNTEKADTADIDKQISDLVIKQINGKISQKEFDSKMDELKKQRESIKNSGKTEKDADTLSKDEKIDIYSKYMHMMYKGVSVEKWKEECKKLSDDELNERFNEYAESHPDKLKEYMGR